MIVLNNLNFSKHPQARQAGKNERKHSKHSSPPLGRLLVQKIASTSLNQEHITFPCLQVLYVSSQLSLPKLLQRSGLGSEHNNKQQAKEN